MTTTIRRTLTAMSLVWFAGLRLVAPQISLAQFNLLLVLSAVPMVWLIWALARASAHQHANREARAIRKVQGERPVQLPQEVSR